jgi:hypothetical protein
MDANLPIYSVLPPDEEANSGLVKVSLVDSPAVESDFVLFAGKSKPYLFVETDNRTKITGALLIPDKLIYREDSSGAGYYLTFSKEVIEALRDKFHKDSLTQEVNTGHAIDVNDVFLVESWIVGNPDKSTQLGLELPEGSWAATYKVNNPEVLGAIKAGTFKGFSIEAYLNKTIQTMKHEDSTKLGFLDSFKKLLGFAVIGGLLNEADATGLLDNPNEPNVNIPNEDPIATLSNAVLELNAKLEGMWVTVNQMQAEMDAMKVSEPKAEEPVIPAEPTDEEMAAKEDEAKRIADLEAEANKAKEELAAIKEEPMGKPVTMWEKESLTPAQSFTKKLNKLNI